MYITTFYSFKGGVGRTMALVNVAVELVKRGRRVLVVDFDLEAPGLDTFDVLQPRTSVPGIIDFVAEYLASNQAPAAERFLSEAEPFPSGEAVDDFYEDGALWIMPSGAQQATYAANFSRIDWSALYERHDGYLLFEDLKAQWREVVKPDYVLIDSRTGHTDTGGICTRQLPDAVVILFFPNEQNLRGLTKVVRDIRAEADGPRKKEIQLHFVMSNVPDLDDEDMILDEKREAFRTRLDFMSPPLVVHRYDSLSLLNQVVFTKDRPGSRLSLEYRAVADAIVGRNLNLEDRDEALAYLRRAGASWRREGTPHEPPGTVDRAVDRIESLHAGDGEVLFALGEFLEDYRRSESPASLFDRAIAAGYDEPRAYVKRATVRLSGGDHGGAIEDSRRLLRFDSLNPPLVRAAIQLASQADSPGNVATSPAVMSLGVGDRIWLAKALDSLSHEIRVAVAILQPLVEDAELPAENRSLARSTLALRLMGIGESAAAAELLGRGGGDVAAMGTQDAFNYGMATWGETGKIVPEPFLRVVELDRDDPPPDPNPHYLQCMVVAHWAAGNAMAALELESRAREAIHMSQRPTFSCWQYRKVKATAFVEDLDEIKALIAGDASRRPRFFSTAASQ